MTIQASDIKAALDHAVEAVEYRDGDADITTATEARSPYCPDSARQRRQPARPVLVAAWAVVLLGAAGLTWAMSTREDPTEVRRGAPTAGLIEDPKKYGPIVDTIFGETSTTLRADLHAPTRVDDGTLVAVAITGGKPGRIYRIDQCATSTLAACRSVGRTVRLDEAGRGIVTTRVWTVFNNPPIGAIHDCRGETCWIDVRPILDDPHEGDTINPALLFFPATAPSTATGPAALSSSPGRLTIPFTPDSSAPPIPTAQAEVLKRTEDSLVVHLTAAGLQPGRYEILARADSDVVLGSQDLTPVEVGADGTIDIEQRLPLTIGDGGTTTRNGVVLDEGPAQCSDPTWSCKIAISLPEGTSFETRILTPDPQPYPNSP